MLDSKHCLVLFYINGTIVNEKPKILKYVN